MDVDVGRVIANKYELRRLVGEGGMGQVWAAQHVSLNQTLAIKLMTPPSPETGEDQATALQRFQIEAQVAAELSRKSRHIVRVTDHGQEDGIAYLVMELLEGETLDEAIDRTGRLDPGYVAAILLQAAKGIGAAHADGVTHRDLKPGNLFLTRDEDGGLLVKVLDFGIARLARRSEPSTARMNRKLTGRGMVLGSTDYMSPEQALAQTVDARSDVWSLAVVAFEALTGARPFSEPTIEKTLTRICEHQATRLPDLLADAGPALDQVFVKAFAKRIDDRFQSADELARAFEAAAPATRPALVPLGPLEPRIPAPPTAPPTATASVVPMRSSWPVMIGGSAVLAVALIAGLFAINRSEKRATPVASEAPATPTPSARPTASAPVLPVLLPPVVSVQSLPTSVRPSPPRSATPAVSAPPTATPTVPPASSKHIDKGAIL